MGLPKIPSQFARPPFKVPTLPAPPTVFAVPANIVAKIASLGSIAAKLPALTKNPLAAVNPGLSSKATQVQSQAQNAARTKLNAVQPPVALPSTLAANPAAVTTYLSGMRNVLAQANSPVDEFGQPKS